jgi:hypothetical protein
VFLFDSFDEIPEILHLQESERIPQEYAQAIESFLTSTGNCKAFIASREFKGPETRPWAKIRNLPLSL